MPSSPDVTQPHEIPFSEMVASLDHQYDEVIQALEAAGLLTILPVVAHDNDVLLARGETLRFHPIGVVGADGTEYPIPTKEYFLEIARANKAVLREKWEQGFKELSFVPLALPLATFKARTASLIRTVSKAGGLLAQKHHADDPDTVLDVNTDDPVYLADQLDGKDTTGDLRYFPDLSKDGKTITGGRKKHELLTDKTVCAVPGWIIELTEPMPFLPKPGEEQTLAGRKQIPTNTSSLAFLETLRDDPSSAHESASTPEAFFTRFTTYLATTHEVTTDWGDANAELLPGVLTSQGDVAYGSWGRYHRGLSVGWGNPDYQDPHYAPRPTVRLVGI